MRRWMERLRQAVSRKRKPTRGQQAAASALARAQHDRLWGEARGPAVQAAADVLRGVQQRNHLGEMIRATYEGRRTS